MAVAIFQTAFIGDVVLTTPLFEAARVSCPGERVAAVVRAGCDNLLGNNPNVDDVIAWDKYDAGRGLAGIRLIARMLRERDVGTMLVPHRSFRSALTARLSGARTRIGFDRGGGKWLHTKRVPYRYGIHEVERNLMLAEAAGWRHEGFAPAIFPDDHDRAVVDGFAGEDDPFCVLAPGSIWATKRWPPDYFAATGRAFTDRGYRVFLSGGMDDVLLCGRLTAEIPEAVSTCGRLTLRQSAELYRRAAFVLTGDTAPQHLAAAMGTRVFSLFGPTVRSFGFWPYSDRSVVIEEEGLECRPCGPHGPSACPKDHHRCLRDISPERVIAVIDEALATGD